MHHLIEILDGSYVERDDVILILGPSHLGSTKQHSVKHGGAQEQGAPRSNLTHDAHVASCLPAHSRLHHVLAFVLEKRSLSSYNSRTCPLINQNNTGKEEAAFAGFCKSFD